MAKTLPSSSGGKTSRMNPMMCGRTKAPAKP
jgi:hypothetical protein